MSNPPSGLVGKLRRMLPTGDVGEQAVKSGVWATVINVADRALQLGLLVVLGNLLPPSAFGLMGIALVSLAVMRRFSKFGLDAALIQRKEVNVDRYLNTVWTIKVLRGLAIVAVALLVAPAVADFFQEPRAADILPIVALSPLCIGLQNPRVVYYRKNLAFHLEFVYRLSGTAANVAIAIAIAIAVGSVWALVLGFVAGDFVRAVVSYLIDWRIPRPELDLSRAWDMVSYGKWITGYEVFAFLFAQGDDVFVGWLLGASALGFYQMAYRLSRAPSTEVTQVISQVMFPTYSKIQDDLEALRSAYFRVLQLVSVVAAPMAVGIATVSPLFVETFLGEKWRPMVPAMQLLAIWGLALAIGSSSGSLFKAVGKPDYITKVMVAKTALLAVIIYPATEMYGITGTAAAIVVSALLTSEPIINYLVVREIRGRFTRFGWTVGVPLGASLLMGGGIVLITRSLPVAATVPHFLAVVASGVLVYTLTMLLVDRWLGYGATTLVASLAERLRT